MDYYSTLGLKRGATDAEIKKAYRSMAMKHHPDRGGNEQKFKEVSAAYDVLSDPQKRQMYDMGVDPNRQQGGFHQQSPFEFHFNSGNFEDVFGGFGFGGFGRQPIRRNRSLSINIELSLEDVLIGKELNAEVGIPNGKKKIINISIPPGVEHGQQIRYQGMGDDSLKDAQPGDLIINILIRSHEKFVRDGDNLIYEKTITAWDAMLGAGVEIETLDKKKITISIPPGTQPETILSCRGEGLPNIRHKVRGNLLMKVKVEIPKNLTDKQKQLVNSIQNNGI
jgi:curved DNA-binding protein